MADIVTLWLETVASRRARPREAAGRAANLLAAFGGLRCSAVTAERCRAYARDRGEGIARRELEDLRAAGRHAQAEGKLARPLALELPARGASRERFLTRAEAARLLLAAWRLREHQRGRPTGRHRARHVARFILVALYTGTRAGAICAASWRPLPGRGHVDCERGIFVRRPAGERETSKRRPPVPLPRRLLAHLRRWKRLAEAREAAGGAPAVAVVEWNGRPVSRLDKAFRAARAAAGLGPEVVGHSLRHTAASWGMQAGADLARLSRYLGMTVETLERVYGHFHPAHLQEAGEAITSRPKQKSAPAR